MTLDLARLPEALRDHGVRVKVLPDWLTTGYRPLDVVGQMSHHTAIDGPATDATAAAMRRGRSDLAGPLSNGFGGLERDRRFTCWLVAGREAHHAGHGSSVVLREVRAGIYSERTAAQRGLVDDVYGNPFFWAWEWQHPGTTPVWHDDLLDGVGRCGAAFCDLTGLPPETHTDHKRWTRRKIDLSWTGSLPDLTRRHLEDDMPLTDADLARIDKVARAAVRDELNRATERPADASGARPSPYGGGSWARMANRDYERGLDVEDRLKAIEDRLAQGGTTSNPADLSGRFEVEVRRVQ